jgi:hypothetical protein
LHHIARINSVACRMYYIRRPPYFPGIAQVVAADVIVMPVSCPIYEFGAFNTICLILFFGIDGVTFDLFCSFLDRINSLISILSLSVKGGLCITKSIPSGSFIKPIVSMF